MEQFCNYFVFTFILSFLCNDIIALINKNNFYYGTQSEIAKESAVLFLSTFCQEISVNVSAPTQNERSPDYVTRDEDPRWKFGKLLSTIANVNKQRLNALKRYVELDEYNVANGILRLANERDPMVAVFFVNKRDPTANKLYEIYDSDLKSTPGDTPVRYILQQIKDHHDDVWQNEEREAEDLGVDIIGDILDKPYGINVFIERDVKEHTERDGKEHIEKYGKEHIERDEKELIETDERDGKEPSDGEEIVPSKNNIQAKEINNTETSDGEEIGSKKGRNIPRGTDKKTPSKEIIFGKEKLKLDESKIDKKQILRLFKSCNKKAVKSCKKACKAASKRTCESFKCSKSMKKSFKKHCNKECKSKFSD